MKGGRALLTSAMDSDYNFLMDESITDKAYVKMPVKKISTGGAETVEDSIAVETRLLIAVNGKEALSLLCSPIMVKELVVGFLMTEGVIKGQWCTDSVSVSSSETGIRADVTAEGGVELSGGAITSGCAGGKTFPGRALARIDDRFSIGASRLADLYAKFQSMSALHRLTGCVHSAALTDGTDMLSFAEDIGRHNALDKVIGYCLLEGIGFGGKAMLTSGRVTSEVVSKCLRWGIPLIASRAAPTDLALRLAVEYGMTVAGFLRGTRLNVYTHTERIL